MLINTDLSGYQPIFRYGSPSLCVLLVNTSIVLISHDISISKSYGPANSSKTIHFLHDTENVTTGIKKSFDMIAVVILVIPLIILGKPQKNYFANNMSYRLPYIKIISGTIVWLILSLQSCWITVSCLESCSWSISRSRDKCDHSTNATFPGFSWNSALQDILNGL